LSFYKNISHHRLKLCMLFTCALFFYAASAQHASMIADRYKILIGEPVILQIKAEDINAGNSVLQNWFELNDTSKHIQIIKKEAVDTVMVNGLMTYMQRITVTSFDSGHWAVPLSSLILTENSTGKQTVLHADSLFIDVLPVDVSALKDYHPEKEIIDVTISPDYKRYIIIGAAALALLIAAIALINYFRRKKPVAEKPLFKGSALDDALLQIRQLQQQDLPAKGQVKLFYSTLNDICRQYFSRQLNLHAHSTSDELMVTLVVYLQEEKRRTAFYQLLRLTDAVKFAKYIPAAQQHEDAIQVAIASLQHIDQLINQSKQHDK